MLQKYQNLIGALIGPDSAENLSDPAAALGAAGQRPEHRHFLEYARQTRLPSITDAAERASALDRHRIDRDRIETFQWPDGPLPAANASMWIAATFNALAWAIRAERLADSSAASVVRRKILQPLLERQRPAGHFLLASSADAPELLWYHELVLLHALCDLAAMFPDDERLGAALLVASDFHLNETQVDHATLDPWGLAAFVWNPATRIVADQMLHQISMQPPPRRGLSLMLLADALYCLRRIQGTS
jgi:hypothetical protein